MMMMMMMMMMNKSLETMVLTGRQKLTSASGSLYGEWSYVSHPCIENVTTLFDIAYSFHGSRIFNSMRSKSSQRDSRESYSRSFQSFLLNTVILILLVNEKRRCRDGKHFPKKYGNKV